MLPPQRGRGLRRGDVDPRRRSASARAIACPPRRNGNTPAGRVRSPAVITATRSSCWTRMPGIRPTARTMPGRAGACCRTTWGCSTCWGTSLNGVKTASNASRRRKEEDYYNDIINISESIIEKNPRLLRGGSFIDPPADVRSAIRDWIAPSFRLTRRRFPPLQDLPLIYFKNFHASTHPYRDAVVLAIMVQWDSTDHCMKG